jgi:hypothetical protein
MRCCEAGHRAPIATARLAGRVAEPRALLYFARVLRRRGGSESKFAFPDQHQIANVNHRVRQIRQDANRIAPENEVNAHERASGNTPVPERYRNHTFALPFGGEPLDKETHREKGVPNETKDHEITPIKTEEPIFLSDPGDSNKCEHVHRQCSLFNPSPLPSQGRACGKRLMLRCNNCESPHLNPLPSTERGGSNLDDLLRIRRQISQSFDSIIRKDRHRGSKPLSISIKTGFASQCYRAFCADEGTSKRVTRSRSIAVWPATLRGGHHS